MSSIEFKDVIAQGGLKPGQTWHIKGNSSRKSTLSELIEQNIERSKMKNKEIHIIGGGTFSYVRNHLALASPAFGTTALSLLNLCTNVFHNKMDVKLHLTKMADPTSKLVINKDIEELVDRLIADLNVKIIFFNVALCDFEGELYYTNSGDGSIRKEYEGLAGKHGQRAKSSEKDLAIYLSPADKIISKIRETRKDIFLVAFKTTTNATKQEQYLAGLNLLKKNSCNLVLANDVVTRNNMITAPEESVLFESTDRDAVLRKLVEITELRSHLTFTRSTVVAGAPIPWNSELIPDNLRTVVNYCIRNGAYKEFNGSTAGHFAVRLGPTEFLTSRRKTNFNNIDQVGLVRVVTDGPDTVMAYGSKPSVGGQSQRIVFENHPGTDCIVHFHCKLLPGSAIPTVSQEGFECGSHECGKNTSGGLKEFWFKGDPENILFPSFNGWEGAPAGKWIGPIYAVYLDNHGPNIVFSKNIDPRIVIDFIEKNFDLSTKTGGYNLHN